MKPAAKIPVMDLTAQDRPAGKAILKAIQQVIKQKAFINPPILGQFEQAFAKWVGRKEFVGVNSGTAALFLALKAMGIGPGDEVITTPFTFIATLESIIYAGAKPVMADIDPDTFCLSPVAVRKALTSRTRAIIPVHLYGHPCDMDEFMAISREANVKILEDVAQAHGATWRGRKVGVFGHAAAFSFYPGKNLGAYGDAGGVATDDPGIAERLRILRNHGHHQKYIHDVEGYNERLDGMQAAVLLAKLPHLDLWIKQRQAIAKDYNRALKSLSDQKIGIRIPPVRPETTHAYHLYVLRIKDRERISKSLTEAGISTAVHYPIPLHLQPCFAYLGYRRGDFPESERAAQEVLSIPLYPGMTKSQEKRVINTIINIFSGKSV